MTQQIDDIMDEMENAFWDEFNYKKTKEILEKHLTSKAPTAEVCKSCLWKKKLSVYEWVTIWSADFPWDKNILIDKWWIKMVDCSRCKGTWFEPQEEVCNNCHWEKQLSELSTTCGRCKGTWFEPQEVKVDMPEIENMKKDLDLLK